MSLPPEISEGERRETAEEDLSAGPPTVQERRIPNLGQALLFVTFAGLVLLASELALLLLGKVTATVQAGAVKVEHPKLQVVAEAGTYIATLLASWLFYPVVWRRSFLSGVRWNWAAARQQAGKLAALGLLLGLMMQVVTYFVTPPKTMPIDAFFMTASDAWLITLFGTVVAPVFEEIAFRGFLVPAFAIAYDWLTLPRTETAREYWRTTTALSPVGLMVSAVLTSVLFAGMHAQQVGHMGAALAVLFSVSLVLTFVRLKTQSVAASAMVHAAYNGFVFLTVLVATGGYRHLERMGR